MTSGSVPHRGGLAGSVPASAKQRGDRAESQALAYLQAQGLQLVRRNFHTPGRGGGEIDLIMRAPDGTLVFVEVRQRRTMTHGGAGASVSAAKQRRLIFAARHFLMSLPHLPPCRFDVVAVEGEAAGQQVVWIRGAFVADGY